MALLDEMYDDIENKHSIKEKSEIDSKISKVQSFLLNNRISKWYIVSVSFGDHLLKNNNNIYRNAKDSFSVEDMKTKKGLNYGEYEFCYDHMAVILSDVHHKYINDINSIIVVPISSTRRKNSILMEKEFNNFLSNDSYILLDKIRHISLERINIKKTQEIFKTSFKQITPVVVNKLKDSFKELLDIN